MVTVIVKIGPTACRGCEFQTKDVGVRVSVVPLGYTSKLTGALPADPLGVGVAVTVPLYVPAAVLEVTVTEPQLDEPPAHVEGPVAVVPAALE